MNETKETKADWQQEQRHLAEYLKVIKANIGAYEKEIAVMNADIDRMYDQYRHDDPEIFTELSNTITMNEHMKASMAKNKEAVLGEIIATIQKEQNDIIRTRRTAILSCRAWQAPVRPPWPCTGFPLFCTITRKQSFVQCAFQELSKHGGNFKFRPGNFESWFLQGLPD